MEKFVVYYRVSTKKQGESKLGLEAQEAAVKRYCNYREGLIIAEYTEIETGTSKRKRIQIHKALEHCKQEGATLLIAKLDRLSRDSLFMQTLLRSIEKGEMKQFICVDNPDVNQMTIEILTSIAAGEARTISKRIKEALQSKRQRGEPLGNINNFTQSGRLKGVETIKLKASTNENNIRAKAYIDDIKDKIVEGRKLTLKEIADKLNKNSYRTSKNKLFTATHVHRLK